MVWILLLSGMDLSTHALTPLLGRRAFGVCQDLTGGPEAFQRLSVRTSIPCYRDFILDKCRSLGFASASPDSTPYSGSLSLRHRDSCPLTSPGTATRRFIMQKARRHNSKLLRPLVGVRFQGLFHSPNRGPFHLSFTVLVHYRSLTSI